MKHLSDNHFHAGRPHLLRVLSLLGWFAAGVAMTALAIVPNATLFSSFGVGMGVSVIQALPLVLVRWRPAIAVAVVCAGAILTSVLAPDVQVPWSAAGIFVGVIVIIVAAIRTSDRSAACYVVAVATVSSIAIFRHGMPVGIYAGFVITVAVIVLVVRLRVTLSAERQWRALEQTRRAAEAERTALSAAVHDVVGHHLAVIALTATAEEGCTSSSSDKDRILSEIAALATSALAETRAVLEEQVPLPDRPSTTTAEKSLWHLVDEWSAVGVQIDHDGLDLVDAASPDQQHEAYQVVRQALTNAVQHGTTKTVRIEIAAESHILTLRVINASGPGPVTPGRGLSSMRERLALGGHALSVGAEHGQFVLTATLVERENSA